MTVHTVQLIRESLKKGETSPQDWLAETQKRLNEVEPSIQSFLYVKPEQAADLTLDSRAGSGTLFGVPYALKDNMCVRGVRTTAASRILANYVPPYSATVAEKLDAAGGLFIGKTNMDEFAMGSSTENSGFHKTRNPYNVKHVPGGSSGGSAAAVAAGIVPFALGSDTGGSIRQPAAYCGVVGLKPTYGRVSRYGLIAFASSLDQIGPFAQTAEDCALVLSAISGHDALDSTSAARDAEDFTADLHKGVKGLRIGVVRDISTEGLQPAVREAVDKAISSLQRVGAEVVDVTLPHSAYAVATYYLIAPAEASSNLARYDGVRFGERIAGESLLDMYERTRSEGFGMEVKRRIIVGTYALSSGYYDAYYVRAQKMRTLIQQDFATAFEMCDVIVTPTAPTTAFAFGEKSDNPLQMYLNDIYTIPANLAGIPGISVPCGLADGLPIGLQILGPAFAEKTVLRVAHTYEQCRGFAMPQPNVGNRGVS